MSAGRFVKGTVLTLTVGVLNFIIGLGASVILARALGPEGRGTYALATLLASFIVTFGNLGIGSATVYYVARCEFKRQEILGNNILLALSIGAFGVFCGLVVVFFLGEKVFPGVSSWYLIFALFLIPTEFFLSFIRCILLGLQRIKEFNYVEIIQHILFLLFIAFSLLFFKVGVIGAIAAMLFSLIIVDTLLFQVVKTSVGGVEFKPNILYLKKAITYGVQAHLSNILGFLNYRVDMFIVNWFLGPSAVGLYSIAVGLVEKLWMVSFAASTVLFPRVAAENDEESRKRFTPLVARTILWTTACAALALLPFSRWIVLLLYSEAFLPAVGAVQALLVGIISLSVGRVLANDIAARGFPGLNIYTGIAAVSANIILNLLWIPRLGIVGAAWASTVSYTVSLLLSLLLYCRLSGNQWTEVIFPQRGDWTLFWKTVQALGNK